MAVTHSPRASLDYNSQLTVTGSLPDRHTAGSEAPRPRHRVQQGPETGGPRCPETRGPGPTAKGPSGQETEVPGPRDGPETEAQGPRDRGPRAKAQGATGPGDRHPAGEGYLTLTLTWLVCNDHQCMDDNIYTLYVGMHFIH